MKRMLIILALSVLSLAPLTAKASMTMCWGNNSVCGPCNFNIKWSDCVNGNQYSSVIQLSDCSGGITPPSVKECNESWPPLPPPPPPPPQCQESSFRLGDWTPCVNNVSVRAVVKTDNGCAGGYTPSAQQTCGIPPTSNIPEVAVLADCKEDNYAVTWEDCLNGKQHSSFVKNIDCTNGYVPPTEKDCQIIQPVNESTTTPELLIKEPKIDSTFAKKQIGKILLQVESHGEAWYVNPKGGSMYYMADGDKAYSVMRNFGVGITNKDLEKIQANSAFAKKNSGKIFLQVESRGEAYYIDFNGTSHYLKDGAAAYEIMRSLGLGITNDNLSKIPEGSF